MTEQENHIDGPVGPGLRDVPVAAFVLNNMEAKSTNDLQKITEQGIRSYGDVVNGHDIPSGAAVEHVLLMLGFHVRLSRIENFVNAQPGVVRQAQESLPGNLEEAFDAAFAGIDDAAGVRDLTEVLTNLSTALTAEVDNDAESFDNEGGGQEQGLDPVGDFLSKAEAEFDAYEEEQRAVEAGSVAGLTADPVTF